MSQTEAPAEERQRDEIDYFLDHEEERPQYTGRTLTEAADSIKEEVAQIKASLWELTVTVARSGVKYLSNMVLRRVMCLVTVQQELVKDGRLAEPFVAFGGGGGVPGAAAHVLGGFLAAPRAAALLYRTGGLSALVRGGKVYLGFCCANYVFRNAQNLFLTNALAPFLEPHLQSQWRRAVWLVCAFPILMHLTSWPLKAVRNLVMTNYMADLIAPVGGRTPGEGGAGEASAEGQEQAAYLYGDVGEVWQVLYRELGGWRGILGHGFAVELAHTYAVLGVRLAINEMFTTLLARAQAAEENKEAFMRPLTLVLTLNGMAACSNCLLRPFHVVSTRMALLASVATPTRVSRGDGDGDAVLQKDVPKGRRYKNGLDCVRTIVREEGLAALWVGAPQVLVVNTMLPVMQMLLMGTVWLSFVDFGNGAS